jgi:hypothetical protein
MNQLAVLQSVSGRRTNLGFDFPTLFGTLAERLEADVAIVSTEEGFSPLGGSRDFFERDLGISYADEIKPLANWNSSDNEQITLIALASRRPGSLLRGVILAPGETARCYQQLPPSERCHRPCRDFYYNVTYEAIAYACGQCGAHKIAISHLSGSGRYHENIATCHTEALAHYCDDHSETVPESFIFCGCCINPEHLQGIQHLNYQGKRSAHRPIQVATEIRDSATLLHLERAQARRHPAYYRH